MFQNGKLKFLALEFNYETDSQAHHSPLCCCIVRKPTQSWALTKPRWGHSWIVGLKYGSKNSISCIKKACFHLKLHWSCEWGREWDQITLYHERPPDRSPKTWHIVTKIKVSLCEPISKWIISIEDRKSENNIAGRFFSPFELHYPSCWQQIVRIY